MSVNHQVAIKPSSHVLDQERQISLIWEMIQLRKDSQSRVVYYHRPSTNAMWKSYFLPAKANHRGPKVFRTEPVAEAIEQRLDSCLIEP